MHHNSVLPVGTMKLYSVVVILLEYEETLGYNK